MSIDNFSTFSSLVDKNFQRMVKDGDVFLTDIPADVLWTTYLTSFPDGTNPIYKEKTEHDCHCCRHFIRDLGAAVSVDNDGNLHSIWDIYDATVPPPYNVVARALSKAVKSYSIIGVFRTKEKRIGIEKNRQRLEDGAILTWNHFSCPVPRSVQTDNVDAVKGEINTTAQILFRGLKELSITAVDEVLELINANALYRGTEHKAMLTEFRQLKAKYDSIPDMEKRIAFAWANYRSKAARFRNSVIGTLVVDLSDGVLLETAVKCFEAKVAPSNYKRTSALITKGMVDKALADVAELGLEPALARRYAVASDINVNDVLFASRSTASVMKNGDLSSLLMDEVVSKAPTNRKNVVEVSMDDFIDTILPDSKNVSVLFENRHQGNLVSLTAPINNDSQLLFKWNNNFAWSYNGNMTDSIKMKVKAEGGNVSGIGRVSLSWSNYDDLDLHVVCHPNNGRSEEIYFGHKNGQHCQLDVDKNAGTGTTREPVENVTWPNKIPAGTYDVNVHNFSRRESIDVGFTVETEFPDGVKTFSYEKGVRSNETVPVVSMVCDGTAIRSYSVKDGIKEGYSSKEQWNIKTEEFHDVEMLLLSPNCWNDAKEIGNKHWIFALKDCKNPDSTLGFYNEFLRPELIKHRKVFEILSNKMKCLYSDEQLSGLGFSSTIKNNFMVKVEKKDDSSTRVYNVVI